MLDDTSPSWWYEQDGQQAGPVTAAAIARLVAEGRLAATHRVWRDGMPDWQPLSAVPELLPALQPGPPAPPPLLPAAGYAPPHVPRPGGPGPFPSGVGPAGPWATPAPAGIALEEISVGATVALCVVTFGIYGLVKFHQTGKTYEALAGRASSFSRSFWIFVGLGIVCVLGNAGGVGVSVPLAISSLVFQVLTLKEALALRDEAVQRAGIRPALTPAGTHKALFIAGVILSPLLVGLVLLLVQAAKWFGDWNAIGAALAQRPRGSAAASPAAAP